VVPSFSDGTIGPTRVFLAAGQGGIDHDSILYCDEIVSLDMDFLSFEDGPLGDVVDEGVLEAVVIGVRRAVGDIVPL
jgi:hypothetical protein